MDDLEKFLEKVLRALAALGAAGWHRPNQVALRAFGTTQMAPMVEAIAAANATLIITASNGNLHMTELGGLWLNRRQQNPEPRSLNQEIAHAVRRYAEGLDPVRIPVGPAATLESSPVAGGWLTVVEVDRDEPIPYETPVSVIRKGGGQVTQGKVVGHDVSRGELYLRLQQQWMPVDLPAWVHVDRRTLLSQLADRVDQVDPASLKRTHAVQGHHDQDITIGHEDADVVALALDRPGDWSCFLWGPPGSGKTYGVSHLLGARARRGRVLAVAPSNRAIDVLTLELLSRCSEQPWLGALKARRGIVRFGYPRLPEILACPEILGPADQGQLTEAIRRQSLALRELEQRGALPIAVARLRAELLALQEQLRASLQVHIEQARIVLTTVASAVAGPLVLANAGGLLSQSWDTLVVDEVTMVSPAACFLLAAAAPRSLFAGDPRQLGPIFEGQPNGEAQRAWLARDPFEAADVGARHLERLPDPPGLARVTSQRRCPPELWQIVSHLYPAVGDLHVPERSEHLRALPPNPGHAVAVLDLKSIPQQDRACESAGGSWRSPFSADCAIEVATTCLGAADREISVAIITPYRAQVALLRDRIRVEATIGGTGRGRIEAGTVHQFQGSEADVVILDMVDGPSRPRLGALLRGDTGVRLLTVAITRARGKLVVIADREWLLRWRDDNPLLEPLLEAELALPVVAAQQMPRRSLRAGPDGHVRLADGTESPIESRLLAALRALPSTREVELQHRILNRAGRIVSRADFAFPRERVAVYCDGQQWHMIEGQWHRDIRQRTELATLGWLPLVFTGRDINQDALRCAEQVAEALKAR